MKVVIELDGKIVNRFNNIMQFCIDAEGYCEETYYNLVLLQKTPKGVEKVVVKDIDPSTIRAYNDSYLII